MADGMKRFEHGGDVYAHEGVVDFSANLNPLGMPEAVKQALRDNVDRFEAYPDPECRELRTAIARAEGVGTDQVLCTAGATDLIQRTCLALRPARALVTAPCFSGYEEALEQAGVAIVRHALLDSEDFGVTERIFEDVANNPGALVFLCNPNNPTGLTIDHDLLVRIVCAARDAGSTVVLDECFLDFTGEPSLVPRCGEFPNLLVMRAFTKLYAMAGLRLGYGVCSDIGLLERIRAVGQTWAVSTPAQMAGVAALGVDGWPERTRAYVDAERAKLVGALRGLGLRVIDGTANYLMFQCAEDLYEPLLQHGFLVRRCANYQGLDASWYRIAVRTTQENDALIAALTARVSPNVAKMPLLVPGTRKRIFAPKGDTLKKGEGA